MIRYDEVLLEDSGEVVSADIGAWPDGMRCARDELNWGFRPLSRVSLRLSIPTGGATYYFRMAYYLDRDLAELDPSGFLDRQAWALTWTGLLGPRTELRSISGGSWPRSLPPPPSDPPALSELARSPGLELGVALGENPFGWDRVRLSEWVRDALLWSPPG